jgi:hypothetical protein
MRSEYRIGIRIGILVLFFIIRQIYKSNSGPKEFTISSTLTVDRSLADQLQLNPGEQVSLMNRPDTFEVIVSAKGISDRYQEIGVIEDRELSEKVKSGAARGKVEYVNGNEVKLALTY